MDAKIDNPDRPRDLPNIVEIGPEDHGWKVLMGASDRLAKALKQAVNEGRDFSTDAELDDFMKEQE